MRAMPSQKANCAFGNRTHAGAIQGNLEDLRVWFLEPLQARDHAHVEEPSDVERFEQALQPLLEVRDQPELQPAVLEQFNTPNASGNSR